MRSFQERRWCLQTRTFDGCFKAVFPSPGDLTRTDLSVPKLYIKGESKTTCDCYDSDSDGADVVDRVDPGETTIGDCDKKKGTTYFSYKLMTMQYDCTPERNRVPELGTEPTTPCFGNKKKKVCLTINLDEWAQVNSENIGKTSQVFLKGTPAWCKTQTNPHEPLCGDDKIALYDAAVKCKGKQGVPDWTKWFMNSVLATPEVLACMAKTLECGGDKDSQKGVIGNIMEMMQDFPSDGSEEGKGKGWMLQLHCVDGTCDTDGKSFDEQGESCEDTEDDECKKNIPRC